MTTAIEKPRAKSVVIKSHSTVLSRITEPGTTLAIWRRELPNAVKITAKRVNEQSVDIVSTFDPFCDEAQRRFAGEFAGFSVDHVELLIEDIFYLSQRIVNIFKQPFVRVRLEKITDDGCRKFHLDNVDTRLVATYVGPGTQWISPTFADIAREQQEKYTGPLNVIATGEAAIFRGKKSGLENLVFHRSPPLKPSDPARLVAVIDGVSD